MHVVAPRVLHFSLLVRYSKVLPEAILLLYYIILSQHCLPEAILYKIYIVYRDIITLIFGVLSSTIIQISTFSGAFVSEI